LTCGDALRTDVEEGLRVRHVVTGPAIVVVISAPLPAEVIRAKGA